MSYVDQDYYDEVFHGEPVDSADFPSLCDRAGVAPFVGAWIET